MAQVLDRRWRLRFCELPRGCDGECDGPTVVGKEIRISESLTDRDRLETIIHELLHAADYERASEPYVHQTAHDIAVILWKMGYSNE